MSSDTSQGAKHMKTSMMTMIKTNPYAKYGLVLAGAAAGYYGYQRYKQDNRPAIRRGRDNVNEMIDKGKERTDDAASSIKRGADKLKEKINTTIDTSTTGKR